MRGVEALDASPASKHAVALGPPTCAGIRRRGALTAPSLREVLGHSEPPPAANRAVADRKSVV